MCRRPKLAAALLPCALAALAATAAAQEASSTAPPASDAALSRVEPAFNVELGGPLVLSANAGIRIPVGGLLGKGYGHGLLLQVQPGVGGGAVNLGWVPVSFAAQGTQAIAVGVKAKVLRTWGSPWGTEPGRTYGGFELAVAVGAKLSVGYLWKVDSGGAGRDRLFTWGVGIGF